MDRTTLESLLDAGTLQVRCGFHWYDVRRNGKTKTWKRSPERFEVPCKCGFRICFTLNNNTSDNELREKPTWNPELTKRANHALQEEPSPMFELIVALIALAVGLKLAGMMFFGIIVLIAACFHRD